MSALLDVILGKEEDDKPESVPQQCLAFLALVAGLAVIVALGAVLRQ